MMTFDNLCLLIERGELLVEQRKDAIDVLEHEMEECRLIIQDEETSWYNRIQYQQRLIKLQKLRNRL